MATEALHRLALTTGNLLRLLSILDFFISNYALVETFLNDVAFARTLGEQAKARSDAGRL